MFPDTDSLRKHPFLLALRRWGRFVRNVPMGDREKRMFSPATDISAIDVNRTGTILGYAKTCCLKSIARIDRMPLHE